MARKKTDKPSPQERGTTSAESSSLAPSLATRFPDVVLELVGRSEFAINCVDPVTGRVLELRLFAGENRVSAGTLSAFREDEFFRDHVLGKLVVARSLDAPEDGEVVEI